MQPGQTSVTVTREGARVTARTSGPPIHEYPAGTLDQERGYARLTIPLRQRGLRCTVEYGLSDYVVKATLPDHSAVIISPPQEPATEHPPGYPESWLVTRGRPYDLTPHEVLYNSEPGGRDPPHGGSIAPLLAAIDHRPDQLGLPPRQPSSTFAQVNAADPVLHRAGFVSTVTPRGRFHHLPAGMTDPVEQRRAVTRAVDMLITEGFAYTCEAELLDPSLPLSTGHEIVLGDQLGQLTRSLSQAGHTSEAVAALSELTAPGDGVLDRLAEALAATADWWEGLGEAADPLYADRLRRINQNMGVSILEIQALRNELADRHTQHPLHAQPDRIPGKEARVAAALAFSPAARRTNSARTPASPAATTALPPARPPSAPGR
jgi:hypothetical protein